MKRFIQVYPEVFKYSDELIELLEDAHQWTPATISTNEGTKSDEARLCDIVTLSRIQYNSAELKSKIRLKQLNGIIESTFTSCLKQYIAPFTSYLEVTRSEPFSVLRYQKGHLYKPHSDGDTAGFNRRLSGLIYLNNNYMGGELNFPGLDFCIRPERNMLVLFPSNFCFVHESLPILSGTKYAVVSWFR